jgi:hypothetical protein
LIDFLFWLTFFIAPATPFFNIKPVVAGAVGNQLSFALAIDIEPLLGSKILYHPFEIAPFGLQAQVT